MTEILDQIVVFLGENYVYVIGVSLVLILMILGLIVSKKRAGKEKETEQMANINEVETGDIKEVANTIQNNVVPPVDMMNYNNQSTNAIQDNNFNSTSNEEVIMTEEPAMSNDVTNMPLPIIEPTQVESVSTPMETNDMYQPVTPVFEPTQVESVSTPIETNDMYQPVTPVFEPTQVESVSTPMETNDMYQPVTPVFEPTQVESVSTPIETNDMYKPVTPIVEPTPSYNFMNNDTPVVKDLFAEDIKVIEPTNNEERFEKTEVMNFSNLDNSNINTDQIKSFFSEQPQNTENNNGNVLNGQSENTDNNRQQ